MDYQRLLIGVLRDPTRRLTAGYIMSSLGVLLAISGGTWDVTHHLLNKPETFFSPPHMVLYTGVGMALAGAVIVISVSRTSRKIDWSAKLLLTGVLLLLVAGPIDFAWHSAFGLDGLLSPPHTVLVSGMVASSIGAAMGISSAYTQTRRNVMPRALVLIALLPVWMSVAGTIHMFSLPFSNTASFDFNPEPRVGAIVSSVGFPLITAVVIIAASTLSGRRFGAATALGASFILIGTLTSILPNSALWATIPFYIAAIIPIICSDAILSRWKSSYSVIVAGAISGLVFIILYYPLITHTYNEAMENRTVWASLTALIYFDILGKVFYIVALPAACMGIVGGILGQRASHKVKIVPSKPALR